MKYFNAFFGWIWRRRAFFLTTVISALLFFVWFFPFSDLSQLVTTTVARATGNQVFLQFDSMDVHLIPQPAISARGLSIETGFPPLEAKWAKITPSVFTMLFNLPSLMKPQADSAALTRIGFSVAAEDLLGADVDFSMSPGKKSDQGRERSRIMLAMEKLNLGKLQDWSDLPVKMQGQADVETDIQFVPDFQDQPEGEFKISIAKFNLPSSTVTTPMGPLNLPTLTLANVVFRGRLVNGSLIIEDGQFGKPEDPISGRIKGQVGIRFQPMGGTVTPLLGAYNLTVDLNATRAIEKEIGIAFLLFESAKTTTSTGSRYLFRAQGQGMGGVPGITRLSSF